MGKCPSSAERTGLQPAQHGGIDGLIPQRQLLGRSMRLSGGPETSRSRKQKSSLFFFLKKTALFFFEKRKGKNEKQPAGATQ
jgi:hypothetical protein